MELYPDNAAALAGTTELCIAAHHDDIEIMAYQPIAMCRGSECRRFSGVVVADGAGSPRTGDYASFTDEEMMAVRIREQKLAADLGCYASLALLGFKSADIKNVENNEVTRGIRDIILRAAPENIYTHNLADKHDTHVAICLRVIEAIRSLPKEARPKRLYGMEVWRGLDWLCDADKAVFDTSAKPSLAAALLGVFDSQVSGGKRYDLAALGRRTANATFFKSHSTDSSDSLSFGMDMTSLIQDDTRDIREFALSFIERFADEVENRIDGLSGRKA